MGLTFLWAQTPLTGLSETCAHPHGVHSHPAPPAPLRLPADHHGRAVCGAPGSPQPRDRRLPPPLLRHPWAWLRIGGDGFILSRLALPASPTAGLRRPAQGPAVTPSRAPVAERSIPAHPRSPCRLGALCPCPWTLALTQVSTNWGLRGARSISHCLEATSLKLRCCQAVLPPGALEGFPPRFFQLPGFQAPLGLGPCPSAISEKALPSHTFSPCLSVSPLLRLRRTLVIIRI